MLQITATKKFSEYDQTELYTGIDIDEATQDLIYDWYQFKTVCDDEKFPVFFRRKLTRCLHQYYQLCRLENSTFDPLVASYHERLTEYSGLRSETKSGSSTTTGTKSSTDTKNLTDQTILDRDTGTGYSASSSTSDEQSTKQAQKAAPQSIAYSGGGSNDKLPGFDWSYMSGQQQQDGEGSSSSQSSSTTTGTEDSTSTTTHTGTDTIAETTGGSVQDSSSLSGSDSNSTREITTGRDGLTPQEAFLKARQWIVISDAFDWLKDEIKDCFLGIAEV